MQMRAILSVAALCLLALPAHADQYQYLTLEQATRAMQAIGTDTVVQSFCAPCDEVKSQPLTVASISIGRIWEGDSAEPYASDGRTFWEVVVNDQSVDLAYVYLHRDGRWENLALLLGLDAVNVPRYLSAQQLTP
jgi:hypothetical protein